MGATDLGKFGASGGSSDVVGSGWVTNNAGQLYGTEIFGFAPVFVQGGDGRSPLVIRAAPGKVIVDSVVDCEDTDLVGVDQALFHPFADKFGFPNLPGVAGVDEFIPRSVVFHGHSMAPQSALRGGVFTAVGGTGDILVPTSTAFNVALTADIDTILEVPFTATRKCRAEHLYFRLTVRNTLALKMRVTVFGDVISYMTV